MRKIVAGLLFIALPALAETPATPPPKACSAAAYRQFDFWLGEWKVSLPDGKPAGQSRIDSVLDGCALHESWTGASGFRGNSYNGYDATRGVWHQTWVDVSGTVLMLDGKFENGAMVLQNSLPPAEGQALNRITWTPRADGSVRQLWQTSSDQGSSWTTAFDGIYVRASSRATAR